MSEYWRCAFIGEGTSDNRLAKVLERLLMSMRPGADVNLEPEPHEWNGKRPNNVEEKIKALAEEPYDLIFVHRDADNAGIEARIKECRKPGDDRVVPVIPVTMTEAWVLADLWSNEKEKETFRAWAAGKGLSRKVIEGLADPKRTLEEYLNRDRSSFMKATAFARKRSQLVEQIRIDGDVKHLEAWKRLEKELESALVRNRQHLGYE
ncbi:hypothetical protein [Actinomyces glycerinitolerans]|uniref:DUF4276 family protein n=1 Tax=Actinomyces glycerinitolerans TaxID=1892869 RepID=A0A1M4RVM9_9ACTO|nr:hypothetical protein [Actinomyces glycerinitolerans]SHE24038.1 Hypothetical protein ACGLYG10_0236 [Actinomyces glycerinitolerans]